MDAIKAWINRLTAPDASPDAAGRGPKPRLRPGARNDPDRAVEHRGQSVGSGHAPA